MPRVHEPPSPELLAWVAHHVHARARVTAVVPLTGGITAAMDRITVDAPTGVVEVVLRRWPDRPWVDGMVAREVDGLSAVRGHGVPAPELVAMDEDGAQTGVPCTLTTALTGQPDLAPTDLPSWLGQLAAAQAAIHAAPARPPTRWQGWYAEHHRPLAWLTDRGLRDAARAAADGPIVDEEVLVHGDYQHFNVLWSDGRLTGVVDWPNAATGNRGSDVGHCRLNLAVLFGAEAAGDYLVAYERAAGDRLDRVADLRALLCFDLDWLQFIPLQIAGRAPLDVAGIPDRVTAAVRAAVDGMG